MSATVGVLLLLARRPENIELEPVDPALLVRETAPGAGLLSLDLPESREVQAGPPWRVSSSESAGQCPALLGKWPRCRAPGRTCAPGVQCGAHPRGYGHLCPQGACRVPGDATPGGSGLGLSLVRRACEHLGWSVSYRHSGENETLFEVRFVPDSDGESMCEDRRHEQGPPAGRTGPAAGLRAALARDFRVRQAARHATETRRRARGQPSAGHAPFPQRAGHGGTVQRRAGDQPGGRASAAPAFHGRTVRPQGATCWPRSTPGPSRPPWARPAVPWPATRPSWRTPAATWAAMKSW